jgi:hypothetical protein
MAHQQNQQKALNNIAFVLGNGTSRSCLKLDNLKTRGTVYGCNALYREFEPDHLIAVDVKMVNEIIGSGYHKTHSVWTNPNKGITSKQHINLFSPHKGWSSGPTALWFACTQGHKNIYIFGFDYQGINGKFNNVYADTFNYKKSTDSATFFGNWLNQTEKTIKEYRSVNFYRIADAGSFVPEKLSTLPNLQHMTFEEFDKIFPDSIYFDQTIQKTTI